MSDQKYTASMSRSSEQGSWVVSFRHPLVKDAQGKQGLKVRRGLGTNDEAKANELVAQLNELLANEYFHSLVKRSEAARQFAPVVVAAFYDKVESAEEHDRAIKGREQYLPLPGKEQGYARALLVGTTGAGKTSLLRHLIDTNTEKFPATSGSSRTTTAAIEVITGVKDAYKAVVAFYSEVAIRQKIQECVEAACWAVWDDRAKPTLTDKEIADKLLQNSDQTFRLNYTLGNWTEPSEPANQKEDGDHAQESVLVAYVARVRSLVAQMQTQLNQPYQKSGSQSPSSDDTSFSDMLGTMAEFDALVDDIMGQIRQRFALLTEGRCHKTGTGWLEAWEYETHDRNLFLEQVKRFTSNDFRLYGQLLAPIVQGIRVSGDFQPAFLKNDAPQKLVWLDGQGLGHTSESVASVSTHITDRYPDVDAILLVDSAKSSMQAAALSVLRSVITQGHQQKLAIVFTHLDEINGDDVPSFAAKRDKVLASVRNGLTSLRDVLEPAVLRGIERDVQNRCYFLGDLNKQWKRWGERPDDDQDEFDGEPLSKEKQIEQVKALLTFCQRDAVVPTNQVQPVYDLSGLGLVLQQATSQFHALWNDRLLPQSLGGIHQRTLGAFNRKVAYRVDTEHKHLKPVAEFAMYLTEAMARFLSHPLRWHGDAGHPISEEDNDRVIEAILREVAVEVSALSRQRLIDHPLARWQGAARLIGDGSTPKKAREIQGIYQAAAPEIQDVRELAASEFLDELRQRLYRAICKGGGKVIGYSPFSMPTFAELEQAYRDANQEYDPVWDVVVADGLADETW